MEQLKPIAYDSSQIASMSGCLDPASVIGGTQHFSFFSDSKENRTGDHCIGFVYKGLKVLILSALLAEFSCRDR